MLRAVGVDPFLNEGKIVVRNRGGVQPAFVTSLLLKAEPEGRDQMVLHLSAPLRGRARPISKYDQSEPNDLPRHKLIARQTAPERSMGTNTDRLATNGLIQDLHHFLKTSYACNWLRLRGNGPLWSSNRSFPELRSVHAALRPGNSLRHHDDGGGLQLDHSNRSHRLGNLACRPPS